MRVGECTGSSVQKCMAQVWALQSALCGRAQATTLRHGRGHRGGGLVWPVACLCGLLAAPQTTAHQVASLLATARKAAKVHHQQASPGCTSHLLTTSTRWAGGQRRSLLCRSPPAPHKRGNQMQAGSAGRFKRSLVVHQAPCSRHLPQPGGTARPSLSPRSAAPAW